MAYILIGVCTVVLAASIIALIEEHREARRRRAVKQLTRAVQQLTKLHPTKRPHTVIMRMHYPKGNASPNQPPVEVYITELSVTDEDIIMFYRRASLRRCVSRSRQKIAP